MNKTIFRAYDIRGIYPSEINEEVVSRVAHGLAKYFKEGTIVLGHDTRLSSPTLYDVLVEIFTASQAVNIVQAGLITTPMLTFLVNKLGARGGVMVTASHNPKEYNGLKIIGAKGRRISGEEIYELISNT